MKCGLQGAHELAWVVGGGGTQPEGVRGHTVGSHSHSVQPRTPGTRLDHRSVGLGEGPVGQTGGGGGGSSAGQVKGGTVLIVGRQSVGRASTCRRTCCPGRRHRRQGQEPRPPFEHGS